MKTETQCFHLRVPPKVYAKLMKEAKAMPGNVSLNTYLLTIIANRKADASPNTK